MYQAFFGLREKPFNLTPDPKFLYLNSSYREALASLHYAIAERKGFAALVGEAGTGKTTLLRRLLSELPRDTRSVLVINPAVSFEELLRFILTDLGRPPTPGTTKLQMTEALNAELLDTLARGGNVVVLIDEAQDLTIPVLEELRLLSNLETAKEKILQFVLAGQPEFESMLSRPEIRQLRQRIAVNARLRPLGRREVKSYVAARIAAAGGDERGLFRPPALYRLWRFSGGVPRLVNVACDNALVTAYAAGKRTVSWKGMGDAVRDLSPAGRGSGRSFGVPAVRFGTIAAAAMLGAGGAYAVSHLAADRDAEPPRVAAVSAEVAPAAVAPRGRESQVIAGSGGAPPPAAARRPARAAVPVGADSATRPGDGDDRPRHHANAGQVPHVGAGQAQHAGVGQAQHAGVGQAQYENAGQAQRAGAGQAPHVGAGQAQHAGVGRAQYEDAEQAQRAATEPPVDVPRHDAGARVVSANGYAGGDTQMVPPVQQPASDTGRLAQGGRADGAPPLEPLPGADRMARAGSPAAERASVNYVRVERGDTITAIVQRHYGYVTPELIYAVQRANPELSNIDVIMVGGTLALPPTDG